MGFAESTWAVVWMADWKWYVEMEAVSIVLQLNQENDLGNVPDADRFEKHF